MGRKRLMTDVAAFEAKTLYDKGMTLAELGENYGVTGPTVAKEIVKVGGTLRPRGRRKGTKNSLKDILPQGMVGNVAFYSLDELNPENDVQRFVKVYESFYEDRGADNFIVYADAEKNALIYTGLHNASKTRMKTWRAEWRKSEDRDKVSFAA